MNSFSISNEKPTAYKEYRYHYIHKLNRRTTAIAEMLELLNKVAATLQHIENVQFWLYEIRISAIRYLHTLHNSIYLYYTNNYQQHPNYFTHLSHWPFLGQLLSVGVGNSGFNEAKRVYMDVRA